MISMTEQKYTEILEFLLTFRKLNEPLNLRSRMKFVKVKLNSFDNKLSLLHHDIMGSEYHIVADIRDYKLPWRTVDRRKKVGIEQYESERTRQDSLCADITLGVSLSLKNWVVEHRSGYMMTNGTIQSVVNNLKERNNRRMAGATFINNIKNRVRKYDAVLDESRINKFIGIIREVKTHEQAYVEDKKSINIKNAFLEYEAAATSYVFPVIFKHLFNSLELIVNYDSEDDKELDKKISDISDVNVSKVSEWRLFYNRLKHVATNQDHVDRIKLGTSNLISNYIPEVEEAFKNSVSKLLL